MAEVDVSAQAAVPTGLNATTTNATTTDSFHIPNDGETVLVVDNAGSEDTVVTVETPVTTGGLAVTDQTVTVPKETGRRIIGPFRKSVYSDSEGKIKVTFSKATGVKFAAVKVNA